LENEVTGVWTKYLKQSLQEVKHFFDEKNKLKVGSGELSSTLKNNKLTDNKFEEREYPATQMVCSDESLTDEERQSSELMAKRYKDIFMRLFAYISGENSNRQRFEMTAPVFCFNHMDSSYVTDRIAMCFWMTQDMKEQIPEPLPNSSVKKWKMERSKFFVRRFAGPGGSQQDLVWGEETKKLVKGLTSLGMLEKTDKHLLLSSSYNPPWETEGRRDEVMLRIKDTGKWASPFDEDKTKTIQKEMSSKYIVEGGINWETRPLQ